MTKTVHYLQFLIFLPAAPAAPIYTELRSNRVLMINWAFNTKLRSRLGGGKPAPTALSRGSIVGESFMPSRSFTVHCPLLTAHCPLLTVHCLGGSTEFPGYSIEIAN